MSWTSLRRGVEFAVGHASGSSSYLATTSVALYRDSNAAPLYLHGIKGISYNGSIASPPYTMASTTYPTYMGYVVGNAQTPQNTTGNTDDFFLTPTFPIQFTGVLDERPASAGETFIIMDYSSSPYASATASSSSHPFTVTYRDASVLYLESLGVYMMILSRARVFFGASAPDPNNSISDIVAYTATDREFTTNLTGPFYLASSIDAMPSLGYRLWLAVPTAFEHLDARGIASLYLYYALAPCDLTVPPNGNFVAVDLGTYPGSQGRGFHPQIGVKVIPLTNNPFASTNLAPESSWESVASTTLSSVVSGTSELIRLWFAVHGSGTHQVVRFGELLPEADAVDPATVVDVTTQSANAAPVNARSASDNTEESISMLIAVNPRNTPTTLSARSNSSPGSYGIWRASMLNPSQHPAVVEMRQLAISPVQLVQTRFGIDWALRYAVSVPQAPQNAGDPVTTQIFQPDDSDRIVPTHSFLISHFDPEPYDLLSGDYRVFMGFGDLFNLAPTFGLNSSPIELVYTDGLSTDLFVFDPWT